MQNDKTLKTKNEKDRRLREKRQNNVKRFMEEKKVRLDEVIEDRSLWLLKAVIDKLYLHSFYLSLSFHSQQIGVKQGRAMEKLKLAHAKQLEEFSTDVHKVMTETLAKTDTITSIETVL